MIGFIRDEPLMSAIIAFCVALVLAVIFVFWYEGHQCELEGGKMVGTGEYSTTYVMSGKVMMPITSENQVCSVNTDAPR